MKKVRLSKEQKRAFDAYRFAEREEDRFMGSVFANSYQQRKYEAKTRAAYEHCKRLGMGVEHGL